MKSSESKESHYLSWDSHIGPKNKRWLEENLEDMNEKVKDMLKLIDVDADSFAQRAEIYYKKRPELISLVGKIYQMYRALAERYDHGAGELRHIIRTDLQSQGSSISDVSSESSTLDSEFESDDSSENNYVGVQKTDEDQRLRKRIIELEVELLYVKEKSRMLQEEISESFFRDFKSGDSEVLLTRIAGYEEELKVTREINELSEEEINKLKVELQKYKSMEQSSKPDGEIDLSSLFQGKQLKMKRSESKKSHSWSHISPRSNRWLQESLAGIDQNVRQIMKIIEGNGNSFARRTEMYYQRRPELASAVEGIHHLYRALAERYDHLTVELQKNIGTEFGSEPATLDPESESESDSDDSSMQNSNEDQGLPKRIIKLEVELHVVKEKFQMLQEEISEGSCGGINVEIRGF